MLHRRLLVSNARKQLIAGLLTPSPQASGVLLDKPRPRVLHEMNANTHTARESRVHHPTQPPAPNPPAPTAAAKEAPDWWSKELGKWTGNQRTFGKAFKKPASERSATEQTYAGRTTERRVALLDGIGFFT